LARNSTDDDLDGVHAATRYAIEAVEGTRVVGNTERLACLRHLQDLARAGQMPKPLAQRVEAATGQLLPGLDQAFPWTFDERQASLVSVEWFSSLVHIEGRLVGQPIELIPAHVFDLSCIFGWVSRTETVTRTSGRKVGVRRFRKAFVTEGRKNAKTTRGAGIGLYMMIGDMEENPAVYCTAVDRRQARVLYNQAKKMAEKSKDIRTRLSIGQYEIRHKSRGGEMTAFSGEVKNKDAFNPSCAFVDEYHAHPTSEIYDLISSAKGQRAQPLMFIITTAGMDVESPCHAEYEYCKLILTGKAVNDRYFVMIRELDEKDDEHDPRNWAKANPLLMSNAVMRAELQDMHDEAFGSNNPAKIRTFRVKNLNRWVHGNEKSFMGDFMISDGAKPSKWDSLALSRPKFLKLTKNGLCVVGVDLSKVIDLTALAYVFALPGDKVGICAHGFMPEAAIAAHEKTDRIPYREWAKEGWLTVTEGNITDYAALERQIETLTGKVEIPTDDPAKALRVAVVAKKVHYAALNGWQVHEVCYDPYNATHFKTELDELGYTTIEVRQTMPNLNEPTKLFRDLVADGRLVHDGSPLLTWCVGNAQEIVDSKENVMVTKKNAGSTRRVDLLAATLNALFRIQPLRDQVKYADYIHSGDFGF
jgi:phage terminase large subunit-like protein